MFDLIGQCDGVGFSDGSVIYFFRIGLYGLIEGVIDGAFESVVEKNDRDVIAKPNAFFRNIGELHLAAKRGETGDFFFEDVDKFDT